MTDAESGDAKDHELRALIAGAFEEAGIDEGEQAAGEVVSYFARITPPTLTVEVERRIEMITVRPGGYGGGSTYKPGNVVLNLRKLVVAIASGALTVTGAMATPWTLVLGALVTWDRLHSCLELEINDVQACVAWSLWISRDAASTVAKSDVFGIVNRERAAFGRRPLSPQEVSYALADLEKMGCIQKSKKDPDRWWLREWVRVKY